MTGCNETFQGLRGLWRVITAELVIHDFHDRGIQDWIGFGLTHVKASFDAHSAGA